VEQKITENTPFTKENFHHVGVIVRDMEKTIGYLSSLGIGPFGMADGPQVVEVPFKGEFRGTDLRWWKFRLKGNSGANPPNGR